MLNIAILQGRLTADPVLRKTPDGKSVCSFSVACERDVTQTGADTKVTDFFDIVAWNGAAEYICRNYTKGRMVIAVGRLKVREWTADDGTKRRGIELKADKVYPADYRRPTGAAITDETEPDIIGGCDDEPLPF